MSLGDPLDLRLLHLDRIEPEHVDLRRTAGPCSPAGTRDLLAAHRRRSASHSPAAPGPGPSPRHRRPAGATSASYVSAPFRNLRKHRSDPCTSVAKKMRRARSRFACPRSQTHWITRAVARASPGQCRSTSLCAPPVRSGRSRGRRAAPGTRRREAAEAELSEDARVRDDQDDHDQRQDRRQRRRRSRRSGHRP